MKINGRIIEGPNEELVVFPRAGKEPIVFKAKAVRDMSDFEKLCPEPKPPARMLPGGEKVENFEDSTYKLELQRRNDKSYAFLVLKSLQATDGLEWDTVKLEDASTWLNWRKELLDAGLSVTEVNRLVHAVGIANSLNEAYLEEARKRFLAGQQVPQSI